MNGHQTSGRRSTGRTIWMYWEQVDDRPRAPYLDLCLETVRRHAGTLDVEVVTDATVTRWLPDLRPDRWGALPDPARRADYARTRLVHRYGGLWLDTDVVVLSSLDEVFGRFEDDRLAVVIKHDGGPANFMFGARAGNPVVGAWAEAQDLALGCCPDTSRLHWTALGNSILSWLLAPGNFTALPAERFAPIGWQDWKRFLSTEESVEVLLADDPVTVMMFNKMMGPDLAALSAGELMTSDTLVARLLRVGLGHAAPS